MTASPLAVARGCMKAYVAKDRAAIETLIDKDYHFTSPIDNALDRATYFARCWPNSKEMTGFDTIYQAEDDDRAFVVYQGHTRSGKTFRNSEVHTVRNGKLIATEVYFGWDLPHKAPQGGFIENEGQGHA
jgi:ketosteroid isomerase-like protein